MSYSLYFDAPRDEVAERAASEVADYFANMSDDNYAKAEQDDHLSAIVNALPGLLEVVGTEDDTFRVVLSGHANEGHGLSDSWANEALTISLTVTTPRPAAE